MTLLIDDPDFTLHVGDALETLQAMPAESVHCCVTSPPYWGLRDYGTGTWEGGDPDCDHLPPRRLSPEAAAAKSTIGAAPLHTSYNYGRECGKCGARRVDQQLGLEPTPDEYVARIVNVFREVRRVLRADGTLWLNIGDSYASNWPCQRRNEIGSGSLENGKREARPPRMPEGLKEKDLVGIPWRLAFALQADGWYLRSDIIWSKPNPMPESVTDRPTKAHEYLFLLTKSPRYFYDADAIREPQKRVQERPDWLRSREVQERPDSKYPGKDNGRGGGMMRRWLENPEKFAIGRNKRSVWEIATEPYPDAHFATFPQALVEPCIKAGCPEWVCGTCGKARERIVETTYKRHENWFGDKQGARHDRGSQGTSYNEPVARETSGWSDCGHNNYQPGTVLDPFLGSGTTAQVARRLGRRCIGIELNPEYAQLAARRLQQQSLFA